MRKLIRFILCWAILAGLFYLFGLELLLEKISTRTQAQSYEQCILHMKKEQLMGHPNSPLTPEQGVAHCRCVSDGLTFTKADLIDVAQRKDPRSLTVRAQNQSNECNHKLQRMIGGSAEPTTPSNPDEIPL